MRPANPDGVADLVERHLRNRTADGGLSPQAVEAVDVVYHALVFTGEREGLPAWRAALWDARLTPKARQSLDAMVRHLNTAIRAGDTGAVGGICDCLETLFAPCHDAEVEPP